eukprot:GHVS01068884.1.p1 GENE.GHVS01068884.1~~GHVS01068884.1.p1  ORF type:complete len:192 (+),score=22.18 GHVS01068884.1:574-1149(+)
MLYTVWKVCNQPHFCVYVQVLPEQLHPQPRDRLEGRGRRSPQVEPLAAQARSRAQKGPATSLASSAVAAELPEKPDATFFDRGEARRTHKAFFPEGSVPRHRKILLQERPYDSFVGQGKVDEIPKSTKTRRKSSEDQGDENSRAEPVECDDWSSQVNPVIPTLLKISLRRWELAHLEKFLTLLPLFACLFL